MAASADVGPSLRRTLLRWLLLPLGLLLALDAGLGWWSARRAADLALDRALLDVARELVLHARPAPEGAGLRIAPAARRLLQDGGERRWFLLADAQGRVLDGDARLEGVLVGDGAARFRDARLGDTPVRVVAVRMAPSEGGPPLQVQVAETLDGRQALARDILLQELLPQLLLIALAAAVVWVGVGHGLAPLEGLRRALAARSHRDLQPLPLRDVPAELQPLVEDVNGLMARLALTLDYQGRFIADAAHQLKTPVSGLKAQVELALRETDPQRLPASLAHLQAGVERLSRLVRQLLALARNEPGAAESLQLTDMDLAALALEVSMEWAPQALRRDIDLGFEGDGRPATIRADPDRLRELLNNLVDNAVRYSRQGGRVTVAVVCSPEGGALLSVHDDGPHIPPDERTRVFERFHRILGTPADGSGLGLAIVSEIAALHGARITLEEDDDGVGNTFSVGFPAPGPTL